MDIQIFNDTTYLDCSLDPPSDTVPSASNCPTLLAYNSLVREGIPRSFDDTSVFADLFSIIVDSGANLVDLQLEGMANKMIIEGKVEWSFTTQNRRNLTIKTLYCYVSDSTVRIIGPQRLFSRSFGAPRKYIIDKDQTTLDFDR